VGEQLAAGNRAILGVMLESFLVGGRQQFAAPASLTYGQSITDACLGWDATVEVLDGLAGAVRARRDTGSGSG
jgi:3-deoxy-7-phosphoheptulonate synthase